MDNTYENIEECNPNKKHNILIVLDDMMADIPNKRRFNPIVPELFIRGRKHDSSLVFVTQSYFAAPKNIILNSTQYFIIKIPNK